MNALVSISCCFDYDVPIERQLPQICAAGFTHVSLSRADHGGYLGPRRAESAQRIEDAGLLVDTIHGPCLADDESVSVVTATLDAAAALGAHTVVVHPTPFEIAETDRGACVELLRPRLHAIELHARATGMTVALENLCPGPATDVVRQLLPDLDPAVFGFCYDSSHDQIDGPRPLDLLAELGDRVTAVHLSDRSAPFVDHLLPGEGFIDFESICAALRSTAFDKPVLLEVMTRHSAPRSVPELLRAAHIAAVRLHGLIYD